MQRLWLAALLGVGFASAQGGGAARPVTGWPPTACLHGTTVNETPRQVDARQIAGFTRALLRGVGVVPGGPGCEAHVSVLLHVGGPGGQPVTVTARLLIGDPEVNPQEAVEGRGKFACDRKLNTLVAPGEDLQAASRALLARLIAGGCG